MGGRGWSFPTLCRTLCRSGVEPPTGTIHPRESRGTEDRKQKSMSWRLSGFGIAGGYWAGVERSDLVPVGGCTPDRNDPPTRKQGNNGQKIEINVLAALRIRNCRRVLGGGGAFRPCAGRGLHPRPERSTHAKAGEQRAENRNQCSVGFPDSKLYRNIWRGWIVPVGGSTPDRHRTDRHRKDIILFWKYVSQNIIARKSEFGDQKNVIIQLS